MGQESRRVEWEQRVAAWKASGLTQKQYADGTTSSLTPGARKNRLFVAMLQKSRDYYAMMVYSTHETLP